ncbi:MAG: hypothetical protein LBP53_01265 [Candidatus Peribacteria bacterium]|jgi:pyruvate/2-oxoacid:ferredoxin oxidoreductase beta subunit|nr:hypothetical protein [Candidatus Peribacteria bacterium]
MFKASIETNSFPQKTINEYANTYGTTIQKEGISYITMYNTIVNTLDDLESDTSVEDTKLKMEKYKTALDKLELQKELLLTTQQQEKTKLLDDIATTQRNITKIKNGESLNESKIKQARNGVTQRQNSLNSLLDKYGDYRLKANFDGVITQMDIQV